MKRQGRRSHTPRLPGRPPACSSRALSSCNVGFALLGWRNPPSRSGRADSFSWPFHAAPVVTMMPWRPVAGSGRVPVLIDPGRDCPRQSLSHAGGMAYLDQQNSSKSAFNPMHPGKCRFPDVAMAALAASRRGEGRSEKHQNSAFNPMQPGFSAERAGHHPENPDIRGGARCQFAWARPRLSSTVSPTPPIPLTIPGAGDVRAGSDMPSFRPHQLPCAAP